MAFAKEATIDIACAHCGMPGAQVRQIRAEGLDLGAERIAADPSAPCCNTIYLRDLEEALSDLESAIAKRLINWRHQTLSFQEVL